MSLLTVRGECLEAGRHMSQRSDLRQNRHLVLHVRQSVYSPLHCPVRVHWFLTQPPAWLHIPVSPGLFPHLLFCSCVCMFNTIFYSRQVDKMYIIHTAKLAGLTSRQVMVMLWLSSKAEYWTYQTKKGRWILNGSCGLSWYIIRTVRPWSDWIFTYATAMT